MRLANPRPLCIGDADRDSVSCSFKMPHKRVYIGRVVRGRSVVVGYEDVHLVGYREGLCEYFSGVCRRKIGRGGAASGIVGQFKQVDNGTLGPLEGNRSALKQASKELESWVIEKRGGKKSASTTFCEGRQTWGSGTSRHMLIQGTYNWI